MNKLFLNDITNRNINEYLVLLYRFLLMMIFFTVFRLLFWAFNTDMFPDVTISGFLNIIKGGFVFDLAALLYLNAFYIIISILPFPFKFSSFYQSLLKWIYLLTNGIGIALNSIDIIYYRFIHKRTTFNVFDILANEENMGRLWIQFILDFWYIAVLFVVSILMLYRLYSFYKPKPVQFSVRWLSIPFSLLSIIVFTGFSIVSIRGGYRHSTRPMNMSNAGKYVESTEHMALVLNTPFCVIRTWGKKKIERANYFINEGELNAVFSPYHSPEAFTDAMNKNVVVIILESFNREYIGTLNKALDNGNYTGYTPFLDSLMNHSLVFERAYANGEKSIDAMPSILASIPSMGIPYTVSEYSSNKINTLPGLLGESGYTTAFFHGAPNGSMGFDAFAKVAGFQDYYGMSEYGNKDDFDGTWGIWDEPFFKYFAREMDKMKQPFMTSLFTVSSHHPFKVPEKYEGVFPKGTLPVHQCVGYTDNALRKFFNEASQMDWYNNTLFVITADHSSASHFASSKTTLNRFAIPLLFYVPGDKNMVKWDKKIAQQIDIMPSVLGYLGYNKPYVAFGNNILKLDEERFVINYANQNYQFFDGDAIIHYDGQKLNAVYDFSSDSLLSSNLINDVNVIESEHKCKAIIQHYNNRMIDDKLIVN